MSFAGYEAELYRQASGVHDSVNLAGEPASQPAHMFLSVPANTGSVLVHTHDGGINHLHRRIMACGQRIHDLVPDASPRPANEAIVTSGEDHRSLAGSRQGAPERKTQKIPFRTRRSLTRGMPRGLMAAHSKSVSSYRIIRGPSLALKSRPNRCLQPTKPEQPALPRLPPNRT